MVINRKATIRWKGYDPNDLSKGSKKRVWANCESCGIGRWVSYRAYRDLCMSCSNRDKNIGKKHTDETKQKMKDSHQDFSGKNHPQYGKQKSEITRGKISKKQNESYDNNPERKQIISDRMTGNTFQKGMIHSDERCERNSAGQQHQDYDAGEWTGFTNSRQPYLIPINKCYQLNKRFDGSHGHHITKSIVVFIPKELHEHIRHNIKTGNNMAGINMLAFQYINGCYDG